MNKNIVPTIIIILGLALTAYSQNNNTVKDDPKGAAEFERMRLADPVTGEIPYEKFEQARKQARKQILEQRAVGKSSADFGNWTERGPNNFGGRTRAIMWDPNNDVDQHKVWAGGVNGGLWVNEDITDPNSEWVMMFNTGNAFTISSLTYDPSDPDKETIFFGTGEYWTMESSTNSASGGEIYKSEDLGQNWTIISDETYNFPLNINYINKLEVDNNGVLYAATEDGLFSFLNNSWNDTPLVSGNISDIEICDDNTKYAAKSNSQTSIYKCNSGDTDFNPINTGFPSAYRIELGASKNNSNILYAIGVEKTNSKEDVIWFKQTTNSGTNWNPCDIPEYTSYDLFIDLGFQYYTCQSRNHFTNGQGYYNLILTVSPFNPDHVIVGGVDLFRSINKGDDWERISDWENECGPPYVHADQHNIMINNYNTNQCIISNDGGIYLSEDIFNESTDPTFLSRNNEYNVTQFYTCFYNNDNERVLGGTQDNGTINISESNMLGYEVLGGDGGYCFTDKDNSSFQITSPAENSYTKYYITDDNWQTHDRIYNEECGQFLNPTCYDQDNKILYAGHDSQRLLRIKSITTSPNDEVIVLNSLDSDEIINFIYKCLIGNDIIVSTRNSTIESLGEGLYRITNPNSSPTVQPILGDLNSLYRIDFISEAYNNPNILLAISGNTNRLFLSLNGGAHWEQVSTGNAPNKLPTMPYYWAEFNPNDPENKEILLATQVGLYQTNDITASTPVWHKIDMSPDPTLSLVRSNMIRVRPSDSKVYVATHGRGIWESDIFMSSNSYADLQVDDLNPLVNSAEINETFEVDVTIKNKGIVDAPYNTSQCYLSEDNSLSDDDILLYQYSMGNIAPGQSLITNNWNITIPGSVEPGIKYTIFVADGLNNVNEGSHEGNNELPIPITINANTSGNNGPDLTVLDEFVSKRVIEQNQSFSVNCNIKNQGDEDATGGWKQKWYLSDNQTYSSDDLQLDYLQWAFLWSDSTSYIHREMTMPQNVADGAYYIIIKIDADNELTETIEYNNEKALAITVGTIPVPELYSPIDDEEEVSFTPTFYWEDMGDDVDTYEFAIYDYVTQNGNTYLQQVYFKSGLTEPTWQVTNFNFDYDEGYDWTVRCRVDGTHGEWATLFDFRTKHYLSKPVLYDPNNYITNEPLTPTFTWNNVNNADFYKLVIAEDEEFDNEVEDWYGLTDNWFTIPNTYLDTATTYFWRVKAYAGPGDSEYSQVFQFRTGGDIPPGKPENVSPVHDTTDVSLSTQLVWNTGSGVSLSYQVDIASDSAFDVIIFSQDNIALCNYSVPAGQLDGLTKYYWRVRGWNGSGYGVYSDSSSFTTETEGGHGTILWESSLGYIDGTPVFDSQGYMWCAISGDVVKINPGNGDTLLVLKEYSRQEFDEGIVLSHEGNTVYTIADDGIFGDGDSYYLTALDLDGNVLWYVDTYCRDVSKPALDATGNLYLNLSDGYAPYYEESSVISYDAQGNFRWRGLVFDDSDGFQTCPVVKGNKVFVADDKIDNIGKVYALNTTNGSLAWSKSLTEARMNSQIPALSSTGISFGDLSGEDYLYYLKTNTGSNVSGWPYTGAFDRFRGATVIDELGNLFNGIGEEDGSCYYYGFNPNGSVKWQNQIIFDSRRSPVLGNNGVLYFGSREEVLYAVNKENGDEIWRLNLNRAFKEMTIGPDGTLYLNVNNPDGLLAIETSATSLNNGHWPVKVHDHQGTNCYDHIDLTYTPTLINFSVKNNQDTTRTIENPFSYDYLNIASHYKISEDSSFSNIDWIALDSNYVFQISDEYGFKTVYFVLKNENGASDTLFDVINYVTSEPFIMDISYEQLNISNVMIKGIVNSNNLLSGYFIEYGSDTIMGNYSDTSSFVASINDVTVDIYIENLLPSTTYFYKMHAFNSGGHTESEIHSFMTYGLKQPISALAVVDGYNVEISWQQPDLDCYDCNIIGYNIYRDSILLNNPLIQSTIYNDEGLSNGLYTYAVSAVYQEGESCYSDTLMAEIAGGGFPEEWNYIATQNQHIIIIPQSITPTINGQEIYKGDYIGAFYQRNENQICGGASKWNPDAPLCVVVYGNDSLSGIKDGFADGEELIWKIKSWESDSVFLATASYDSTYQDYDGNYITFGESGITKLSNIIQQIFNYQVGWNMTSWYIQPHAIGLQDLFQPLIDSSLLIKVVDENGNIIQQMPWGWVNTVGDMSNEEGYQVKVLAESSFITEGVLLALPFEIILTSGWNIAGWPVNSEENVEEAFAGLISDNTLVKIIDENGNILQQLPWGGSIL